MNQDILQQIDDMFESAAAPQDDTGALARIGDLLGDFRPRMVWLADEAGEVLAAHHTEPGYPSMALDPLSRRCARLLERRHCCCFADEAGTTVLAIMTVAGDPSQRTILAAGMDESCERIESRIESLQPAMSCCAVLAMQALQTRRDADEARVRMRQLEHERDTLKASYTHIMNSAIEEREQRLREQQHYTEQLEEEVARRSADLRKALRQAKQASESKSEFLANMSHELRTPLTAILGYTDLMLDPEQDAADREQCIRTVHRNGKHLLSIINDILDLSKIEAGKMTTEIIACSPVEIVQDIAAMMRVRALEKDLEFNCTFEGPIPTVIHSDPTRIRQMIINLVGNAIKFTHEGSVRLVTRLQPAGRGQKKARLRFDIIDSGIGLTRQQKAQLFQPFSQADSSTTRKYGGTGLGLAICRRLADILGGDVKCKSKPGEGSQFTITLDCGPLDNIQMIDGATIDIRACTEPQAAFQLDVPLHGRILLAEDGPDNQRLLKYLLTKAGAEVEVAENGRVAVAKVLQMSKAHPFDLILMDMQMPEQDGYSAATELRQRGFKLPIIALTAHAMAGDRERCLLAGCNDYATKPIDRRKLMLLLHHHLKRV